MCSSDCFVRLVVLSTNLVGVSCIDAGALGAALATSLDVFASSDALHAMVVAFGVLGDPLVVQRGLTVHPNDPHALR